MLSQCFSAVYFSSTALTVCGRMFFSNTQHQVLAGCNHITDMSVVPVCHTAVSLAMLTGYVLAKY